MTLARLLRRRGARARRDRADAGRALHAPRLHARLPGLRAPRGGRRLRRGPRRRASHRPAPGPAAGGRGRALRRADRGAGRATCPSSTSTPSSSWCATAAAAWSASSPRARTGRSPSRPTSWSPATAMRSPMREMAGLEAEFEPLPEAELGFMSPSVADTSFAMAYLSDGGHIGMLSLERGLGRLAQHREGGRRGGPGARPRGDQGDVGAAAARRPSRPSPGVTSIDQIRYSEPSCSRCPQWWVPGRGRHRRRGPLLRPRDGRQLGHRAGRRARAGPGRARQNPDDPDAACRSYELWRAPAVRPYEAMDPGRQRMIVAGSAQPRDEERWPPLD